LQWNLIIHEKPGNSSTQYAASDFVKFWNYWVRRLCIPDIANFNSKKIFLTCSLDLTEQDLWILGTRIWISNIFLPAHHRFRSNFVVSIETEAVGWMIEKECSSISGTCKRVFSFNKRPGQVRSLYQSASYSASTSGTVPNIKANYSPPPCDKVKNVRCCTSSPPNYTFMACRVTTLPLLVLNIYHRSKSCNLLN